MLDALIVFGIPIGGLLLMHLLFYFIRKSDTCIGRGFRLSDHSSWRDDVIKQRKAIKELDEEMRAAYDKYDLWQLNMQLEQEQNWLNVLIEVEPELFPNDMEFVYYDREELLQTENKGA